MTAQNEARDRYFDWRRFFGRFGVVRKSILADMLTSLEISEITHTILSIAVQERGWERSLSY